MNVPKPAGFGDEDSHKKLDCESQTSYTSKSPNIIRHDLSMHNPNPGMTDTRFTWSNKISIITLRLNCLIRNFLSWILKVHSLGLGGCGVTVLFGSSLGTEAGPGGVCSSGGGSVLREMGRD